MIEQPRRAFSNPGNLMKCWPTKPMEAIMATRPCLISEARNLLKPFSSPTVVKFSGSKKPRGATAPICSEGANGGGGGGASASAKATAPPSTALRWVKDRDATAPEETPAKFDT